MTYKTMNYQQNSDEQQGFIQSKFETKPSLLQLNIQEQLKQQSKFAAYYLSNSGSTIKYEIPQALQAFEDFQIESDERNINIEDKKFEPKQQQGIVDPIHPYRYYEQSSLFYLIYSRNSSQKPLLNEFQYISKLLDKQDNDINLETSINPRQLSSRIDPKGKANFHQRNNYSRPLKAHKEQLQMITHNKLILNKHQQYKYDLNETLKFDSKFQSGNLYCAYRKCGTNQYHLFLQNDTNSYGYNQWFYFSIQNARKDVSYTFKIVNFKKQHSFFKNGYLPAIFSKQKFYDNNKNGWYRAGNSIQYQQSNISISKYFKFYTLKLQIAFKYDNDQILIASNIPYSYTRLSKCLQNIETNFKNQNQTNSISICKISSIVRSFCGNNIPQIKLIPKKTNIKAKPKLTLHSDWNVVNKKQKKMIIIMARQHPGQSVSSFLMQQILKLLTLSNSKHRRNLTSNQSFTHTSQLKKDDFNHIKLLLKQYTIVIYPMINVDGVIYGNTRCDITGMDLNRRWKDPSQIFHPQIFHIIEKIKSYNKTYQIAACFDLHGHSKLYNVFGYGCKKNNISCRILSYLISKQTSIFKFPSCNFGISRQKHSTARATLFQILQNQNILTIECSYFGYKKQQQDTQKSKEYKLQRYLKDTKSKQQIMIGPRIQYFQKQNYRLLALGILTGLSIFLNKQSTQFQQTKRLAVQTVKQQLKIEQQLKNEQIVLKNKKQKSDSGSQSDPECDEIPFQQKIKRIFPKQFLGQAKYFSLYKEENNRQQFQLYTPQNNKNIIISKQQVKEEITYIQKQFYNQGKTSQIPNKIRIKTDASKIIRNAKIKSVSQVFLNVPTIRLTQDMQQNKDENENEINHLIRNKIIQSSKPIRFFTQARSQQVSLKRQMNEGQQKKCQRTYNFTKSNLISNKRQNSEQFLDRKNRLIRLGSNSIYNSKDHIYNSKKAIQQEYNRKNFQQLQSLIYRSQRNIPTQSMSFFLKFKPFIPLQLRQKKQKRQFGQLKQLKQLNQLKLLNQLKQLKSKQLKLNQFKQLKEYKQKSQKISFLEQKMKSNNHIEILKNLIQNKKMQNNLKSKIKNQRSYFEDKQQQLNLNNKRRTAIIDYKRTAIIDYKRTKDNQRFKTEPKPEL